MIEYVKGEVTELTPAYAVIEAHGVGYGLNISLNTYSAVQGKKETRLWTYEAIREDAYVLYGFATRQERDMFVLLITVSGVGAGTARMILSSMSVQELCNAISTGDERLLKGVKGIGLRTAQRIIVDLKDKIVQSGIAQELPSNAGKSTPLVSSPVKDEAVSALTMLGFAAAASGKAVDKIMKAEPTLSVEAVIRKALTML